MPFVFPQLSRISGKTVSLFDIPEFLKQMYFVSRCVCNLFKHDLIFEDILVEVADLSHICALLLIYFVVSFHINLCF